MKQNQRRLQKYIDGLEQRMDWLLDEHTKLINENHAIKEKNKNIVQGLEHDVEAICKYLEEKLM